LKKPSLKISGASDWYKTRKQKRKEKEELERNLESSGLKMVTFLVTLAAMALGMSYLPLLPQPLPVFLAVLVAFVAYMKPRIGMPIGGAIIGLGLLYHLADLYFISFLGDTLVRAVFVGIWMSLFIVVPALFNRYKAALAVDFGILAVIALFIQPLFFLAIPVIFASSVFFKKYASLTVVYYVLLSVPLTIIQYWYFVVEKITRVEWWLTPGSAPPLFVSLSDIAPQLGLPMNQFRLYDASNAFNSILGQITWNPDWQGRTMSAAIIQYRDSIPGILMFAVIVIGLAIIMMYFTRMLVKGGLIGSGDRLFPCFTATVSAALFFILLSAFQVPLAFTADVNGITMLLGIFVTLVLTLPVAFLDFNPKQPISNKEVTDKAQGLLSKVLAFETQLNFVSDNIPVVVSSPLGKNGVIKEYLQDVVKRSERRMYDQYELENKLAELGKVGKDHDALVVELINILTEYQTFVNCEYANWVGKLKKIGLAVQSTVTFSAQKDLTVEDRVISIKEIIDAGRALVKEVLDTSEPIYGIIRPLYDPTLPQKSHAVEFAQEKLASKEAPWIAVEALYNALNNWKRQYGAEIQTSMRYLQTSLKPIAYLGLHGELLFWVFGENTGRVVGYVKRAESMATSAQNRLDKDKLDITDVVALKDDVLGFIDMSNDVLLMLYGGLISTEEAIDKLLPTKDFLWEKNTILRERLEIATKQLANPTSLKINEIMGNLPQYLAYVDEAVQTLAVYSERKEFLLNYPLAQTAIEERLKTKTQLLPSDLPFQPHFAAEYLRLYYTQRFGEYVFDKDNLVLSKRP
jgi:hypothetical protein